MKTLKDVAKVYLGEVLRTINPGVPYNSYKQGSSRAYDTGNLFNRIAGSNQINNIGKLGKDKKSFTLNIDIAPNGAVYGQYVHNGTYKMRKRPFAQIAAESPAVKQAIDDYMNGVVEAEVQIQFDMLDKRFSQAGFTVS